MGTVPLVERIVVYKPRWVDVTRKNRIPPIVYVELTIGKKHRLFHLLGKVNQDYLDNKLRSDIRITADDPNMFLYKMGGDRNIVYQYPGDRNRLKDTESIVLFLTPK
jgi:hypothetical protein